MTERVSLAIAAHRVREAKEIVHVKQKAVTTAQNAKRDRETELVMAKSELERAERELIQTALNDTEEG